MFPLGLVIGAVAGATAVIIVGPQVVQRTRPVAKAVLKAALLAMHEARVQSAEIAEAAEDLFAEAKAEATADVVAATMAAAQANAAAQAAQAKAREPLDATPKASTTKAASRRAAVKRSRATPSANG